MLIETYGLTKKYGKKLALNKVNLKIDRGQLVAYLGTNGAGVYDNYIDWAVERFWKIK